MKRGAKPLLWVGATLLGLGAVAGMAHGLIQRTCQIPAPHIALETMPLTRPQRGLRTLGASSVVERRGILEVHLAGTPESIGYAHSRLLYPEMVENEGVLLRRFSEAVPTLPLRWLLLDLAQIRYRKLALGMSSARRREIAAGALGFSPDPYADVFPTFQRFTYLNALYDIALSFEHSPLIGCTTFAFADSAVANGGGMLARAFDFEVDSVFDRKKAVFFVRERGLIPFASVAWPGLVGVVSGMNLEGVAVVVHGGRAGEASVTGEPVVHALRAVLSRARTTQEALNELELRPPMVSHILVINDAAGHAVKVERVPGARDHVVPLAEAAAVTNHFAGPAALDPKNIVVREQTSTLPRKTRADELVRAVQRPVSAENAVRLLRDRRGAGGRELPLGDRNAIDALIATHGVVMLTRERVLWVSLAPHLLGAFVAFDLSRFLAADAAPDPALELPRIAPDPLLATPFGAKLQAGY